MTQYQRSRQRQRVLKVWYEKYNGGVCCSNKKCRKWFAIEYYNKRYHSDITVDHRLGVGSHPQLGDIDSNCFPMCLECNENKGGMVELRWIPK